MRAFSEALKRSDNEEDGYAILSQMLSLAYALSGLYYGLCHGNVFFHPFIETAFSNFIIAPHFAFCQDHRK